MVIDLDEISEDIPVIIAVGGNDKMVINSIIVSWYSEKRLKC